MIKTALLPALVFALTNQPACAGSATWNLNPTNGDWNTASNWTPATVPNGPADTATFGVSNLTNVSLSAQIATNGIIFDSDANAFTLTSYKESPLTFSGTGITNNSGIEQNFVAAASAQAERLLTILFTNDATAGNQTVFTVLGPSRERLPVM